jgi:hypothetical protein
MYSDGRPILFWSRHQRLDSTRLNSGLPTKIMLDGTGVVSGSRRTGPTGLTLEQDVPDVEDREQRGKLGSLEVKVGLEALQPDR